MSINKLNLPAGSDLKSNHWTKKHSIWIYGNLRLSITCIRELDLETFWGLPSNEIFEVAIEEIE